MADALTVFPAASAFTDDGVAAWLEEHGVLLVAHDAESRAPTRTEVRSVLDELGYPYEETATEFAEEQYSDGSWPPFSTLTMEPSESGVAATSLGFRLGPLEGPFEILTRLARSCGAQVALSHSHNRPVRVDAATSWAEFSRGVVGVDP